jgi:3-methyladenine DNA glycosylase Mpg
LRLGSDFYQKDALTVAQELIGKLVIRELNGYNLVEREELYIVE